MTSQCSSIRKGLEYERDKAFILVYDTLSSAVILVLVIFTASEVVSKHGVIIWIDSGLFQRPTKRWWLR
jgi:hypothetical protein